MKQRVRLFLALASLCLASSADAATFQYSYTFSSGSIVSGAFSGTANGNRITGISGVTASLNGFSFGQDLFGVGYIETGANSYAWVPDAAAVSIDGRENNFMFADHSMAPGQTSVHRYFYSTTATIDGAVYREAFATLTNDGHSFDFDGSFGPAQFDARRWVVTVVPQAVLETPALPLMAVGLAALALVRRSQERHGRHAA